MNDEKKITDIRSKRRFGVEIELNSFDNRDFKISPLGLDEIPEGAEEVAEIIADVTKAPVNIIKWNYTNNNEEWIVKYDSTCGIEVCSPVLAGWAGIREVAKVVEAFKKENVPCDEKCSFHVHVATDRDKRKTAKMMAHWIKCEAVFSDSIPDHRKKNSYCQQIGLSDFFNTDTVFCPDDILNCLGANKYYTLNCYHLRKKRRSTVEFRIIENEACVNPFFVSNWLKLMLYFVDVGLSAEEITPYEKGNSKSSFLWLDFKEVMSFLNLSLENDITPESEEVRNWFISRVRKNVKSSLTGIWSSEGRQVTNKQVEEYVSSLNINIENYCF